MTRTPERLSGPAQLSNTAATVYTVPADTRTVIRNIHLENPPGGATRSVTISIGVDAAGTRVLDAYPILTGAVQDHWAYYVLEAGEVVQAFADTGATVVMTMDGDELTGIGSSYLIATGTLSAAMTSAVPYNDSFSLDDSAGSDFAINAGDATTIDVLNDCWAVVFYTWAVTPDAATITTLDVHLDSSPANAPLNANHVSYDGIAAVQNEDTITSAPVFLPAGQSFQVAVTATTSAGTWTFTPPTSNLQIVRVM